MVQETSFINTNKFHHAIRRNQISTNPSYDELKAKGLCHVNALHVAFRSANSDTILAILRSLNDAQLIELLSAVDDDAMAPLEWLLDRDDVESVLTNLLNSCTASQKRLILSFQIPSRNNQTLLHVIAEMEYENSNAPLINVVKNALSGQSALFNEIVGIKDGSNRTIEHSEMLGETVVADMRKAAETISINNIIGNMINYAQTGWGYFTGVGSFFAGHCNINVPFRLQEIDIKGAISSFISKLPSITSSNDALGDASNPAKPSADQIEPQKISLVQDDSGVCSIYANATIAHNNLVLPKVVAPETPITEKINDPQTRWGYFTGGVNNLAQGLVSFFAVDYNLVSPDSGSRALIIGNVINDAQTGWGYFKGGVNNLAHGLVNFFAVRFNNNVSELAERSLNSTIEGQTPITIPTLYPQNAYFEIPATTPDSEKLYDQYTSPIESRRDAIVNASVGAVGADINARTYQEQKERIYIAKEAYDQKKKEENSAKENINYIRQAREIIDLEQPDLNQLTLFPTAINGESEANPTSRLLEEDEGGLLPPRLGFPVSPSPSAASTPRSLGDERELPPRLGFQVSPSLSAASTPRSLGDESESPRMCLVQVSRSSANPTSRFGLLSLESPIGSPIARKMAAQNILEEKRVLLDQAKAELKSVTSESERIDNLLNSQHESTELCDILELSNLVRQSLDLSLRKRTLNNDVSILEAEISELKILEEWLEPAAIDRPSSRKKGGKTLVQKLDKELADLRPLISAIEGQKIDPTKELSKARVASLKQLEAFQAKREELLKQRREIEPSDDDVSQERNDILGELKRLEETLILAERRQALLDEFSPKLHDIDWLQSLFKESTELSLEFKGFYQAERIRASIFDFASGISTIIHYDEVIFKQLNITPPQEYYSYMRPTIAILYGSVKAAAGRDVTHLYNGLLQSRLIDRGVNSVINDSANEQELKLAADVAAHVVLPVLGRTAGMVYANRAVPSFEMWHKGIPGKVIAITTTAALGTNYLAYKMQSQIGYGIARVSNMVLHANTFLNGGILVKGFELANSYQAMFGGNGLYANLVNFGSHFGLTNSYEGQRAIRQDHYNTPLENYRLGFASLLAAHIHCGGGEISANMAYFGSEVRNALKHMAREFNTPLERFGLQYFVDAKLGYIATSEAIALMAVAASFVVPISPLVIGVGLISSSGTIGSAGYALYQGTERVDLSHKSPEEIWCSSTSSGGEDLGLENNGQRVVCHAWKDIKSKLKVNDAEMLKNNIYPELISPKQAQDYLEGIKQGKDAGESMLSAGIISFPRDSKDNVCTQDGGISNLNKAIEEVFCSKLIDQSSPCTIDTFIDYINRATPEQRTFMAHDIALHFAGEGASVVHDEV